MDCKEILEMMGLPDYNAWEIVKRTNACLMEDPFWLRFSEDETFEDTTRGRARRIMAECQKPAITTLGQDPPPFHFKAALLPYILVLLECPTFLEQNPLIVLLFP